MKRIIKYVLFIILSVIIVLVLPLVWSLLGFFLSLLMKYNWFIEIKDFIITYSIIDRNQYIDISSTLLCVLTSSIIGYAAFKLSRKTLHNNNVKTALFVKYLFENSLKSVCNIHNRIPNAKIVMPDFDFFKQEFTFLNNKDILFIYELYSKICELSLIQCHTGNSDTLINNVLDLTLKDPSKFEYNDISLRILNKVEKYIK